MNREQELAIWRRWRQGHTVVVSMRKGVNPRMIRWAQENGLLVRVDRATRWGNPFRMHHESERQEVIERYRRWLQTQPQLLERLPELKGKVLACWCHPKPCHADVLAELADATGG